MVKVRFKKGNQAAKKGDRLCANHPFCNNRIDTTKYPNKKYCDSGSCKQKAYEYRKNNRLMFIP